MAVFVLLEYALIKTEVTTVSVQNSFKQLDQLQNALNNDADIIYLGDSTVFWSGRTDSDSRDLGEHLEASLKNSNEGLNAATIAHGGYHAGIFEAFSNYVCVSTRKPKVIVFPINLRALAPTWDTRLIWQFEDEEAKIYKEAKYRSLKNNPFHNFWHRFYKLFSNHELTAVEEQDISKAYKNDSQEIRNPIHPEILTTYNNLNVDNNSSDKIKANYIEYYLYELNPNHRRLISLKNSISNLESCGVDTLLYITPVDYQSGDQYVGNEFSMIIAENINKIFETVDPKEKYIVDFSKLLDSKYFNYKELPNEHLWSYGKELLANELGKKVILILNK